MTRVSVIIPFFQRDPGILRRALVSVSRQHLSPGISVDVIVVDDGSPVSAQSEAEGVVFQPPFRLIIIRQPNGGVAAARNAGLKHVDGSTTYIAFLDSDDTWHDDHLNQGINSLENGYDFYFCDNEREGHHDSYFASSSMIRPFVEKAAAEDAAIVLTKNELTTIILRDFPTQASTTIYRRSIAPDLLFDNSVTCAGEDVIFFMQLASRASRSCFSPRVMVKCGTGVNMYFGNLNWDSPGYFRCLADQLRAHVVISKTIRLEEHDADWNDAYVSRLRRRVVFHSLRCFVKSKGKWPPELKALAREDKRFIAWFLIGTFQVTIGRALGLYRSS